MHWATDSVLVLIRSCSLLDAPHTSAVAKTAVETWKKWFAVVVPDLTV